MIPPYPWDYITAEKEGKTWSILGNFAGLQEPKKRIGGRGALKLIICIFLIFCPQGKIQFPKLSMKKTKKLVSGSDKNKKTGDDWEWRLGPNNAKWGVNSGLYQTTSFHTNTGWGETPMGGRGGTAPFWWDYGGIQGSITTGL